MSDLDVREAFTAIWSQVCAGENYVPRDYQTIGGMWTVDTWKAIIDGVEVTAQQMDEGWTMRLIFPFGTATRDFKNHVTVSPTLGTAEQVQLKIVNLGEALSCR